MHSHLLPNLDDGVRSFEQAEEIIRQFISYGYTKLITTPHVMSDMYRNTSPGILKRLEDLRQYLGEKNINIQIEAAAEYCRTTEAGGRYVFGCPVQYDAEGALRLAPR